MGAPVKYRADARYELGELLPSAISRLRKLLKQGKAVAQSWANKDEVERIQKIEDNLTQLMEKAYVDKWMINAAVHYNEWANFKRMISSHL